MLYVGSWFAAIVPERVWNCCLTSVHWMSAQTATAIVSEFFSVLTESNRKAIEVNGPTTQVHASPALYAASGPSEMEPDCPPVTTVLPEVQHGPKQYGFVALYCPVTQTCAAAVRMNRTMPSANTALRVMLAMLLSFIHAVHHNYFDCICLFNWAEYHRFYRFYLAS